MRKIYNKETGRLFAGMIFVLLTVFLIGNAADRMIASRQREAHQQFFAAFFGNVKAMYPEVAEEEWIALLNGNENMELGKELLQSYGILEGHETFGLQEKYIRAAGGWMNGCLLLLFIALCGCFVVFLQRRQQKIEHLTGYLQNVAQGNYLLEIEDQREDDLSSLQNELYKIVVLLREQAKRLKEQKKALADSVSDISHQLKTPLTSVMVLVDNLSESSHMEETVRRHFLSEITAQLGSMAWLVAVMLKLSRLDAGVVELERRKISGRELLQQVVEGLEQQAEWRGIDVELEILGDAEICGDAKWLREALANIVKNGIEHCPEQGKVTITMEDNAVYTQIDIRNYGDVLSLEEQKHIFERFYRRPVAEPEETESEGGHRRGVPVGMENTGIGLSLAKEIIERQNGFITVESAAETGTVFTVKLMKTAV